MKALKPILASIVLMLISLQVFAQDEVKVSEKKDVAVFALGYYGYRIPSKVLGTVDASIQSVFVNLGRFNVLGQTTRFSTADINQFIEILRKHKEENTPLPEEVKFGEVQMTEALLNQLYSSFIVVIPTITAYTSEYNSKAGEYQTNIKTSVAFINVAEGTTFGWAQIDTSGSSAETETKAIEGALSGIASQLEYEVRSIPAFTITTRVLSANFAEVRMQLGQDMGIRRGDEFAVIEKIDIQGFQDQRETGLIMVKSVGPTASTATVLYGAPKEGGELLEIPRMGVDISLSLGYLQYFDTRYGWGDDSSDGAVTLNLKGTITRGFYGFRPAVGMTVLFDGVLWYPLIANLGFDYNIYFRRLAITANAGLGVGTSVVLRIIETIVEDMTDTKDDDEWISHIGLTASLGASYLMTRDVKLFGEINFTYMLGFATGPFSSYGGIGGAAGICFKL